MAVWSSRARVTVVVGLSVLVLAVCAVLVVRPLGSVWNPDEWYILGANLAVHGTLGIGDEPTVFRPPGYPAFIALVLRLLTGGPAALTPAVLWDTRPALYLAQALALALGAAGATFWWSGRMSAVVAASGALALGANPYVLALTGLPHYALVHLVLLVLGSWGLSEALRRDQAWALAGCGLLWGGITLVRPITLPLPVVVFVVLWASGVRGRALFRRGAAFALGFALAVAPWTIRNYGIRGRLVPVNAQGWTVLWGATAKPLPVRPNHFNWYVLARGEYEDIFRRVTGNAAYGYRALYANDVALEDAFRTEALANLRRQPLTYLGNVARAVDALVLHTSSLPIRLLVLLQRPGARLEDAWFVPGHPQDFGRSWAATGYVLLSTGLLPVAALGLVAGVRRRDRFLLAPAGVGACVVLAHALTYMDLFYYYVRLPFLFLFASYGFDVLRGWASARSRSWWLVDGPAMVTAAGFVACSLALLAGGHSLG